MDLKKMTAILTISFLAFGFTWGNDEKKQKGKPETLTADEAANASEKRKPVAANKNNQKQADAETVETTGRPSSFLNPIVPPPVPIVPPPVRIVQPVVPPVDPQIIKINKEIEQITRLNEMIKVANASHYHEIQKVMEQTKLHQQILENISENPVPDASSPEGKAEATLRQEKIKVIAEETKKNRAFIESLDEEQSKPISSPLTDESVLKIDGIADGSAKKKKVS